MLKKICIEIKGLGNTVKYKEEHLKLMNSRTELITFSEVRSTQKMGHKMQVRNTKLCITLSDFASGT